MTFHIVLFSLFQVTCSCGESLTLDTTVRGRGKDAVFALAKCSKLDCRKIPILEQAAQIQNKLTLEIRGHISRYYSGWITCEDPGCSGRTRQMPLVFQVWTLTQFFLFPFFASGGQINDHSSGNCYFITPKCSYKISAGSKFVFCCYKGRSRVPFFCAGRILV